MLYNPIRPSPSKSDPENAHILVEGSLRSLNTTLSGSLSFFACNYIVNSDSLKQKLLGLDFNNPMGLTGGFDKNAAMIHPLTTFGFGFLEFGTFIPEPQGGNEKPRSLHLVKQESIQDVMGFNNQGTEKTTAKLSKICLFALPLGASMGRNKITSSDRALEDYFTLFRNFKDSCDYFTVNTPSLSTKNSRELQSDDFLSHLLEEAREITDRPILIRVAPDMPIDSALKLYKNAILKRADGFITANTSVDYSLFDNGRTFDGISGRLITEKSGIFFKGLARVLFGKASLITSGGMDSGGLTYERIKNGANLIQVYTVSIFKGPSLVRDINKTLMELLRQDGFTHTSEAVGVSLK